MARDEKKPYEILREGNEEVMKIDANSWNIAPSIEDSPEIMNDAIEKILEVPSVSRLIFNQRRNYSYNYDQTQMLVEIANIYHYLTKQKKVLNLGSLGFKEEISKFLGQKLGELQYIVLNLLRSDPIGAYVEVKRFLREEKILLEREKDMNIAEARSNYVKILLEIYNLMDKTKLISIVRNQIDGYHIGDRMIYRDVFRPVITPDFMFTRVMAKQPIDGEELDVYKVGKSEVVVFKLPNDVKNLYHVTPPEFKLNEDKYELLDLARTVLAEHKPREEEFLDPQKMRKTFYNIGKDMIGELAEHKGLHLDYSEIEELAEILVRYTVGFGLIEILLQDPKIQDITINSPIGETPIFIVHQDYDECVTNILPSREDGDSWASKFRLISGRPLDEANPVLDTELDIPGARARVAVMQRPLSPSGLAYALRRHRDTPWTLPLFIKNGMLSPLSAGLISFLAEGGRTMLFAGTRSSGKCVDGNTLIQLSDGSIKKIKNMQGEKKKTIADGHIYHPISDAQVPSLYGFDMRDSKITDVWKRKSPEKLIKLKTRSGKEIITTCEHPYFVYASGLKNIRADALKKGDLIASPRKINLQGRKQFIDISKRQSCREILEDYFILRGGSNSLSFKFPKEVTPDVAEFLGLIIGDGHLDEKKLEFHNSVKSIRDRYKFLLTIFGIRYREFKSRTTMVVQVSCREFCRILHEIFEIPYGDKASKIFIPRIILKSNDKVLSRFLRGYFDTDGYIPNGKRDIELCTASNLMAEQLKLALLRFGIIAFYKLKKINYNGLVKLYYRIFIRGQNIENFSEHIGFLHPFKKKRLYELESREFIDNTNVDVIPDGNRILSDLRSLLRVSPKQHRKSGKDYWANEKNQYRMTRSWFRKLINFYKAHYSELLKQGDEINVLRQFVKFDYRNYLSNIEKLRELLGLSYVSLASDLKLSDTGIRNDIQKNRNIKFSTFNCLISLTNFFEKRIEKLNLLANTESNIENISSFVETGAATYSKLSKDMNIPQTTLKSYILGDIEPSDEIKTSLENKLVSIKKILASNLKTSSDLLNALDFQMPAYSQIAIILSNFRLLLNVKNEELLSDYVSSQTVSNFFSGKYMCRLNAITSLTSSMIDIYDSCVNSKSLSLLHEADKLANSDIFWDEVSSIEFINKVDEWVYDLTVDKTHNFVANGLVAHNTSLLGATMLEIMRKHRIITVEDTLELNTDVMRNLGYNIQSMKVRAALTAATNEVEADEGVRASLRLGDSALIVGEIRSSEAKALYEAMRIGALANVVAGTIHGDSPYGVYDRVVNDLGVPKTSFKATDVIILSNPVRSSDGLTKSKRVMSITEVRKHWEEDPLKEKGFLDLMKYNPKLDTLEPTQDLINGGSEVLKSIAGNVKEWAGDWDKVWENIMMRARVKELLLSYSEKTKLNDLLEAGFVVLSNDMFHKISDSVHEEAGEIDSKRILFEWEEWLKREIKKRSL